MMTTLWPILYTFLTGILYAALGVVLYHRRNGETAEKSAPNPLMQTLYRCGIALPVLLPLVIVLFVYGGYDGGIFNHPGLIVVTLVVSLILYLSYEVITQKCLRGILKTLPSYMILVASCVLFVLGAKGLASTRMHILPEANEISGIQLETESDGNYYRDEDHYYSLVMRNLVVQSDRANAIVSDMLRQNVTDAEKEGSYYAYDGGYRYHHTVRIHLKNGGSIVRLLSFPEQEGEAFQAALSQDTNYTNALRQLPSSADVAYIEQGNVVGNAELTNTQLSGLYEALTAEMASLSDTQFAYLINLWDMPQQKDAVSFGRIIFGGQYNYRSYTGSIEITPLTPHAFSLFIQMVRQKTNSGLSDRLPKTPVIHTDIDMNLTLYDLQNGKAVNSYSCYNVEQSGGTLTMDEDTFSAAVLIRDAIEQGPTDYILEIAITVQGESVPDGDQWQTGYVYLTPEQAQTLQDLLSFE